MGKKCLLLLTVSVFALFAKEIVKIAPGQSNTDVRQNYAHILLRSALDVTVDEYGEYEVRHAKYPMNRNRALAELEKGDMINVHEAATREEWENKTLPIYIPTRKGLLGYRIFLIHRKNAKIFLSLTSISELKKLKAGLRSHWSITGVMDSLGFNIVRSPTYTGLFPMLDYNRFDYFSRGINEIFNEYQTYQDSFPSLIIEPTLAMYIATPSYFFVSPKAPELHKRLQQGLELLIQRGTFDTLFNKYHAESIKKANLSNRRILSVNNPLLTDKTPLDSLHYWYTPQ